MHILMMIGGGLMFCVGVQWWACSGERAVVSVHGKIWFDVGCCGRLWFYVVV